MARIRSSRWWGGLTGVIAVAFVAGVALLMGWNVDGLRGGTDSPDGSPSVSTAAPSPSAGPVSAPDEAIPLTATILDSVEPGWILTTYNSSSGRYLSARERSADASPVPGTSSPQSDLPFWDRKGARHLYIVDRSGTVYEGADLGVSSDLEPRLWLPGGRTVVVARPEQPGSIRVVLFALDLITGELSAPFDGPAAAPSFGSGSSTASPSPGSTPTPITTPAPTPAAGEASPVWTGGDVRLAASGDALLVTDGEETRQWVRLSLEGRAIGQVIPPVVATSFVEDPAGSAYVAGERVETTSQRWSEEDLGWMDVVSVSWHTIAYAATPTGEPESDRIDHRAPPEEVPCGPLSWAPARQLLNKCVRADGTTVLYTVALRTNTFVKAALFPTTGDDPFFTVKPDATRVAVGRTVYSIVGEVAWEMGASAATPTDLVWSGGLLVAWGDRAATTEPGYGASEIRAFDAFDGDPVYTLIARPDEAGFGPVIPSS